MLKKAPPKIVVIVGPTASGKTDLGIFLAQKFNGEIVNADSRQIYRGMDIATAKPKLRTHPSTRLRAGKSEPRTQLARGVRHHLFDIADPDEVVTVAIWKQKAIRAIRDILRRGKLPMVVGGTGLYIKTIVENLEIPEVPPNPKLRARLERELARKGIGALWQRLVGLDPEAIQVVQPTNPRRVIRALEVCLATHEPFTKLRTKGPPLFEVLEIGIGVPRAKLYHRIDRRIDWQIAHGLVDETKRLLRKYPRTLPAMSGIGYIEMADFLGRDQEIKRSRDQVHLLREAGQKIKFHTHDYARRQLAWFRRDPKIHWIENKEQATHLVQKFLSP